MRGSAWAAVPVAKVQLLGGEPVLGVTVLLRGFSLPAADVHDTGDRKLLRAAAVVASGRRHGDGVPAEPRPHHAGHRSDGPALGQQGQRVLPRVRERRLDKGRLARSVQLRRDPGRALSGRGRRPLGGQGLSLLHQLLHARAAAAAARDPEEAPWH